MRMCSGGIGTWENQVPIYLLPAVRGHASGVPVHGRAVGPDMLHGKLQLFEILVKAEEGSPLHCKIQLIRIGTGSI